MRVVPLSLKAANAFVEQHHRHHTKVQGCKFCIGAVIESKLVGIAIAGRTVSRHLDTGLTAEITRLCTDGTPNACSFLYAACARIAKQMGFTRIQTYILETESGVSLKAAGWEFEALCGGGSWNVKSRPRNGSRNTGRKKRFFKEL